MYMENGLNYFSQIIIDYKVYIGGAAISAPLSILYSSFYFIPV